MKIQAGFKGFKARQEIKDLKVSSRLCNQGQDCVIKVKGSLMK